LDPDPGGTKNIRYGSEGSESLTRRQNLPEARYGGKILVGGKIGQKKFSATTDDTKTEDPIPIYNKNYFILFQG
jgi:hypothetical protein